MKTKKAPKPKKKEVVEDLNVYKVVSEETEYSNETVDYDKILFTYAPMPLSRTRLGYRLDGKQHKFSKTNKLYKEDIFHNLHVAFRKGIDTKASCIAYNAMSLLKQEHRRLLCDTFAKVLPESISCKSDDETWALGFNIEYAFDLFFKRLDGHIVDFVDEYKLTEDKKRKRSDRNFLYFRDHDEFYKKKYDINYRTIVNSFRLAIEIEKEQSIAERKEGELRETHFGGFYSLLYEYDWE